MTIRTSTLLTAGLLAGLILAGSLVPVHAGDGRGKKGPTAIARWSAPQSVLTAILIGAIPV
jgi:hypothetical protein